MTAEGEHGPDLRQILARYWARKWLILPIIVLLPAAVYLFSSLLPKTYEASTTLHVQQTSASSSIFTNQIDFSTSSSEGAARLIETTAVASKAAQDLGESPKSGRALLGKISVDAGDPSTATEFLTITARDSDPERAAAIANAFGKAITETRTEDAVSAIDKTTKTLESEAAGTKGDAAAAGAVTEQLQELRALRASQSDTTQVLEPAVAPGSPVSPTPRKNAALAFVLALILAAAMVPLADRLDRRIREPEELEDLTGVPLLAVIPEDAFPGRVPSSHVREAFQTLRASLTYFNIDRELTTVAIASSLGGDGKTTVAVNLAIALALDQRDVILVDADMRRPQVAKRLGIDSAAGLESVLIGDRRLDDAIVEKDLGVAKLRVLPSVTPPPNAAVLLGSKKMRALMAELAEQADIVIIDTPPLMTVSDAIPIVEQASGTVLVARLDQTKRDALSRTRQVISTIRGTLLGMVATGAHSGMFSSYGYFGGGYGDGDVPPAGDFEQAAPPALVDENGKTARGSGKSQKTGRRRTAKSGSSKSK